MKENKSLEFKESVTNSFLKTVSAFANYEGGKIIFGVDDSGEITGIENPTDVCLSIENKINDSISPQPSYTLSVQDCDRTIHLDVKAGPDKPYFYKSKAYRRNDTATVEVGRLELTRLILKGNNINYEELPADVEDLSFSVLEQKMKSSMGIEKLTKDILITLNLFSEKEGYNIAAALLSDSNKYPGIDIARFGDNINIIKKRAIFDKRSILQSLDEAVEVFRDYYQYDEIVGMNRVTKERIPEEAFREAVANALIHRTWDGNYSQVRVAMYDDRIEIISMGGLPEEKRNEDYYYGNASVLRNPIIANVFYRLGIVELFGTGIPRIISSYNESITKPKFEHTENLMKVTLPVMVKELNLTEDERNVYEALSKNIAKPMSEILENVEYGKTKTTNILQELNKKGFVLKEGNGRGTKYRL